MKVCVACEERFETSGWRCPSCSFEPKPLGGHRAFDPELAEKNTYYDPAFYEKIASIEPRSFWFRSRSRLIAWALKRYFPTADNFLELGCGTGFILSCIAERFPSMALYGGDVCIAGLDYTRERLDARAELFQLDCKKVPYCEEFAVIGAFDLLEHVKEDERVLAEAYKALGRGGGLILTVPQHSFIWSRADALAHHVRRYSAKDLRGKLERAGFKVLYMGSFVSLLFPLMAALRLTKKRSCKDDGMISELRLGKVLNYFLERVQGFERFFIMHNVRFPFGGSLLAVARKD